MLAKRCMYTYISDGILRGCHLSTFVCPSIVVPVSLHTITPCSISRTRQATCSYQACVTRTWQGICLLVLHAHVQIGCHKARTGKIGTVSESDHSNDSDCTREMLLNPPPKIRYLSTSPRLTSCVNSCDFRNHSNRPDSYFESHQLHSSPFKTIPLQHQRHVALTSALC